ncbi:MAG: shikimate kinase, partial [Acidobacteriota bacterium]|nr:shikimate kinase [Acidobacteriota bacterium]
FAEPGNRRVVEDHGVTVWLDCPLRVVERRLAHASHRPLARDPKTLAALYEVRRESYALADIHVPITDDDPAVAVEAILGHPLLK